MYLGPEQFRWRVRHVEQQLQDIRNKHRNLRLTAEDEKLLEIPARHVAVEYAAALLLTVAAMGFLSLLIWGLVALFQ